MKRSIFWKNPGYKTRSRLSGEIECDYLIVGGGVTGVSLAYFLSKYGAKSVCLIEKETIGSGATGKSAGIITLKAELDLQDIINKFGHQRGLIFWHAAHRGMRIIKQIMRNEKLDCDYDVESTIYACSERYEKHPHVLNEYIVEKDIEKTTRFLVGKELQAEIRTPIFRYAILSKGHAISLNPLKFTQNLSLVAEKMGAILYERTPLLHVRKNYAITPKGKIKFKKIIMAMDTDLRSREIKRVETTIIVTERLSKKEMKQVGIATKKVVWDSKKIYNYLKITPDNRILMGYGDRPVSKHHKIEGPHIPHLKRIQEFLHKLLPNLHKRIEYAWSGTFGETHRKVPLIKVKSKKIIVGGAASQLFSIMAANYVAHKLLGRRSALDRFFRFKPYKFL